jgi:hypothetical protein
LLLVGEGKLGLQAREQKIGDIRGCKWHGEVWVLGEEREAARGGHISAVAPGVTVYAV